MSDESYSLHNIMTNLAARTGSLEGALKTFMENWTIQDKLAHDAQRITYERIDLLGRQLERIATDLENIKQDLAELKKEVDEKVMPTIDTWKLQKAQSLGARGMAVAIWGGAVVVISALAYAADRISGYLFPKP